MARNDATDHPRTVPSVNPSGALNAVVGPFARTGRYYADTWRHYLAQESGDVPLARPTLAIAAHAFRDEIALLGLRARRPIGDAHTYARIDAEVHDALRFYGDGGWLEHSERFFTAPSPPADVSVRTAYSAGRPLQRLSFTSGYTPRRGEPGGARWLTYAANTREYAIVLRHRRPRPWLVCVHGTEMGRARLDLAVFRAWHLHHDLGLNVILPVLPLHGPRSRQLPKGVVFPSEDVMTNVHATAQAVWDIRRLIAWIRAEQPGAPVGVYGLSLGGFVAAIVASVEDDLRCAVLGVPVADIVAVLGHHAGFHDDDPRGRTVAAAEPLGRMISPLSLRPRVPLRGRFIYAGVADQLVHPRDQVHRLWEHWGRPEITWYQGGHTGFVESRPVQHFVDAALEQSGLLDSSGDPTETTECA
ncbi:alpha/beta hydrolase family protein [Mycolicibacterium arenosum]|uniref:Alpha/beta hydrolase n=1 Tax=Mycolicibacterium arenosum TaxID=2952157 RepID=A0ABT1LWM6_9MYCO|nr:hypothetical protein [Mycolicibacterium sp. CAU 1645]MCP9270617.1 hypothetical protein [Mycolicibacterium sp. CAU 1645]